MCVKVAKMLKKILITTAVIGAVLTVAYIIKSNSDNNNE